MIWTEGKPSESELLFLSCGSGVHLVYSLVLTRTQPSHDTIAKTRRVRLARLILLGSRQIVSDDFRFHARAICKADAHSGAY